MSEDIARTIEEAKPFSEAAREFGEDVAQAVEETENSDE